EREPRARLLAAGIAYTRFARRVPERYALIFGTPSRDRAASGEAAFQERSPAADDAFGDLVGLIGDCLPAGDPRHAEANVIAKGIWSGLHGFVTLRHLRPGAEWPDE